MTTPSYLDTSFCCANICCTSIYIFIVFRLFLCESLGLFKPSELESFSLTQCLPTITSPLLLTTNLASLSIPKRKHCIYAVDYEKPLFVRHSAFLLCSSYLFSFIECACPNQHLGPCRLVPCGSAFPCRDKLLPTSHDSCNRCTPLPPILVPPEPGPGLENIPNSMTDRQSLYFSIFPFISLIVCFLVALYYLRRLAPSNLTSENMAHILVAERPQQHRSAIHRLAFNEALKAEISVTEDAIARLRSHLERLEYLKHFSDSSL